MKSYGNCAMVVLDNCGLTCTEIQNKLSEFKGIEAIHVYRQVDGKKFIHLSVALVKFKKSTQADHFIANGTKIDGLTAMKVDQFYLNPVLSLIFGLKQYQDYTSCVKTFMQNGAAAIRIHDPLFTYDPFCIVVAFQDDQAKKKFNKNISGMIVSGSPIRIVNLTQIFSSIIIPKTQFNTSLLSNPSKLDFTIHHYETKYHCWSGAAYCLSNAIAHQLTTNPGVKEYFAPRICGPFYLFERYFQGKTIDITVANAPFLLTMAEKLGMKTIVSNVNNFINSATNPYSIIRLIKSFDDIGEINPTLIHTIASMFDEVCEFPIFQALPVSILDLIICSPSFCVKDEVSHFHWVVSFLRSNPSKFKTLIKNVKMAELDKSIIQEFLDLPDSVVDLNDYRLSLAKLSSMAKFDNEVTLTHDKTSSSLDLSSFRLNFIPLSIDYKMDKPFAGIFNQLWNLQAKDQITYVSATASSLNDTNHGNVENIFNNSEREMLTTGNKHQSYIRVKLHHHEASIVGYVIQTGDNSCGHMLMWKILGSQDGENWTIIETKKIFNWFKENFQYRFFALNAAWAKFKYFEVMQTEANGNGTMHMQISKFDVFGTLIPC